jgi:hypothetical protein
LKPKDCGVTADKHFVRGYPPQLMVSKTAHSRPDKPRGYEPDAHYYVRKREKRRRFSAVTLIAVRSIKEFWFGLASPPPHKENNGRPNYPCIAD